MKFTPVECLPESGKKCRDGKYRAFIESFLQSGVGVALVDTGDTKVASAAVYFRYVANKAGAKNLKFATRKGKLYAVNLDIVSVKE